MLTAVLCYAQPLKNGMCTTSEYFLKLPLSVTPIRIIPVIKRLRNLGRIQFIAKSSSIYTKKLFAPQAQVLLEKLAEILLYNFHREHILLKLKIKKLLRKIKSKNFTAGVFFFFFLAQSRTLAKFLALIFRNNFFIFNFSKMCSR